LIQYPTGFRIAYILPMFGPNRLHDNGETNQIYEHLTYIQQSQLTMKMKFRSGDKYLVDMYPQWEMYGTSISIKMLYANRETNLIMKKTLSRSWIWGQGQTIQCSMYGSSMGSLCCIVMEKIIYNTNLMVLMHIMNILVNMRSKT